MLALLMTTTSVSFAANQNLAAPPEQKAPFSAADGEAAVMMLASSLEENFVRPDKGKAYAEALRAKLAAGGYRSFATADEFAKAVTVDLQAIFPDRHLRLFAPRAADGSGPRVRTSPAGGSAIARSGWLADGVAYISFTSFPGNDATLSGLQSFLGEHADAKTLIIDARQHRGGGLNEMDLIFPQIFGRETELVQMDTRLSVEQRGEGVFEDNRTMRRIAGPADVVRRAHFAIPTATPGPLSRAKVYLLTSNRTASAAEHLALSLKRTGRATLIGETTRGAGNYGRSVKLPGGYSAFVPLGRTFDPATDKGWEGVGIEPDVKIPADQALDQALRLAGVSKTGSDALASLR